MLPLLPVTLKQLPLIFAVLLFMVTVLSVYGDSAAVYDARASVYRVVALRVL